MNFPYPENRFVKEIFEDGDYNFLHYYPVVVDVGANIGMFSAWIYDHADKVFAIEPAAENVDKINQLITMNGLDKIQVRQMAISDSSVTKNMLCSGAPERGAWKIDESGDYPVSCLTLKDFFDKENVGYADLVKIDVEGHELPILKSTGFPKDKIGTIIGEIHYHDTERRIELKNTLEWMGFRYYEILNNYFLGRK